MPIFLTSEQLITGLLLILSFILGKVEGISCKKCDDVDQPINCRVSIACGGGEICSTEEYNDVNGKQAYRLGCANAGRCRLFLNAKTLFGKRQISPKCYECCGKDDCNANLCQSSGGHVTNGNHVTIVPHSHHTCPPPVKQSSNSSGCPQLFVPFKDKCYFISPTFVPWMTAKTFCRQHGSNLVSVNSKEEHDFLGGLVTQLKASFVEAFWTGGFYSYEVSEFQYVDGSPFNYSPWYGSPPSNFTKGTFYYVVLFTPEHNLFQDFPMGVFHGSVGGGILCETNKA